MDDKVTKILMIEDSLDDTVLIKRKLENSPTTHFQVTTAKTLQEGLAHLAQEQPDLIISDLGLPDSHGLDTVKRILEESPQVPLVVLSGSDDESVAIKAVQAGAQDYLVKGHIGTVQMERSLNYSIERAGLRRELEEHHREIARIQTNLHKVLEKNADAILVIGKDKKILFCNPAAASLLGRTPIELLTEKYEYGITQGATFEIDIERADKPTKTAAVTAVDIDWEGKPASLVSMHDITERKKMEDILRFSDIALKSIHEGVFTMDNEFKITRWNETCERLLGVKASDAIGKHAGDNINMVEEYKGQNEERFKLLMEKGFNREDQFYRTPRGNIWLDVQAQEMVVNGKRYGWISLISDITERKKQEDMLRYSDTVLKSIHQGVYAMDNDFILTRWNQICEQLFGIKASDAIGKSAIEVFNIDKAFEEENEKIYKILTERGHHSEEILTKTPGGDIWRESNVQAIEDNGKRYGWVALVSDITERKKAEAALKQSEEKYRELINTSSDAIISTDSKMQVIIWNQGAEKIFGYTEKEMLGQSVMKIVPEMVQKGIAAGFGKMNNTGTNDIEGQFLDVAGVRKDGTPVPIELSITTHKTGESTIVTAIIRDITLRKQSEKALKSSEEKYRELINTSNDAIVSIDPQMRFILWNRGAEKMLGYQEKEILGLSLLTIFPAEAQKAVARELVLLKTTSASKTIGHPFETVLLKHDGTLMPADISISTRKTDDKTVSMGIIRDITVRKEAEKKMRQIDQMKSEFLSNVSHELRTPLQSISGFTKLIMNGDVPDRVTQQEFLQIIDSETAHLGNLINSLLDMSRLEVGRFQINRKPVVIDDLIIESLKMFQSLARQKNIELSRNISPGIPEMELDYERIRQVIVNLVGNAIKFSDPGGSVKIAAEYHDRELIFQVIDHGTGIRAENIDHLFERFYREEGETVRGGTGLGLYISRQIIEAHGGRIRAESQLGKGSTFSFILPLNGIIENNQGGRVYEQQSANNRR